MGKKFEGVLIGKGLKIGLVISRYNEFISDRLLDGARDALSRHDVDESDIDAAWTPGAFEMPLVAMNLAKSGKYDAIICLGAIISEGTHQSDYVVVELSKGIARVTMETGIPVIHGVITAETLEQAVEWAGTKMGNKGFAAAISAIETANLLKGMK